MIPNIHICSSGCGRYTYNENNMCCQLCLDTHNNKSKHSMECIDKHYELQKIWFKADANIDLDLKNKITDFCNSFDKKQESNNIVEIYMLPSNKSMLVLKHIIEKSNLKPIICFDYDQTISLTIKEKNFIELPSDKNINGLFNYKTVNVLRGEDESKLLFDYLNEKHVPWFILTARNVASVSIVYKDALKYGLTMPENCNIDNKKYIVNADNGFIYKQPNQCNNSDQLESREIIFNCNINYKKNIQKISCGVYHNSIACSSEGITDSAYAYEKDIALELGLHIYDIQPELIIFIDDNARNVYMLWKHYQKSYRRVHFIGIIYEPIKPESDHNFYLEKIEKKIWSQQIVSNLMHDFVIDNMII